VIYHNQKAGYFKEADKYESHNDYKASQIGYYKNVPSQYSKILDNLNNMNIEQVASQDMQMSNQKKAISYKKQMTPDCISHMVHTE
jgi:hypothetical protein